MKKLCLLVNPRAGKGLARRELYNIVEQFHTEGWLVAVVPVAVEPDALAALGEALQGFDRVVCCGGDGTLNHTAAALLKLPHPPPLGYLPMGSTNDFASTLQYPAGIGPLCRVAMAGREGRLDVGVFCGEKPFCYVAAFGAFTEVSYSTPQETKNALGHAAYLLEGVRRLPLGASRHARVTTDEEKLEGEFLYGSMTNSTSVGGFRAPGSEDVELDDGKFEVMLCSMPKNLGELNEMIACLARQDFSNPYIRLLRTSRLTLEFDSPASFTLDGEFGGAVETAVMEVRPRALRMCLPPGAPLGAWRCEEG